MLRLMVRVADDGVLGIFAGAKLAVVVTVEVIVAVHRVGLHSLDVTVLEEDEVHALGMIVSPLSFGASAIRG